MNKLKIAAKVLSNAFTITNKLTKKEYPSFWFMTDLHTFIRPRGDNIHEIKESMKKIAKEHPYGMVCSVTIVNENDNEIRRVGNSYHVSKDGSADIDRWFKEIIKDPVVRYYDGKLHPNDISNNRDDNNQSIINHLNEWFNLNQKQNNNDDKWITIPILPQYKFKNLKIITDHSKDNEITLTFQYENYKLNK